MPSVASSILFAAALTFIPFTRAAAFFPRGNITANQTSVDHDAITIHQAAAGFVQQDELSNSSCDNVFLLPRGQKQWNMANGQKALDQFDDIFTNDKLICTQCFGMESKDCQYTNVTGCQSGLKELVMAVNEGRLRWDSALGYYVGAGPNVICGSNKDATCGVANCQTAKNNSGNYVLLEGMVLLSQWLNHAGSALDYASQKTQGNAVKFGEIFAPIPDLKAERLGIGIFAAVTTSIFGMLPGVGAANNIAGGVLAAAMNNMFANDAETTNKPTDFTGPLEEIAERMKDALNKVSDALFTKGSVGDGDSKLDYATLMRNGDIFDIPNPDNFNETLASNYARLIFAKMTQLAWQYGQKDGNYHYPFITFAPGDCTSLDYNDGHSVPFPNIGLDKMDNSITWNGTCYWLLDLGQSSHVTGGADGGSVWRCDTPKTLPGGRHQDIDKNKEVLGGMVLEDLIIPSVGGWVENGRVNGFNLAGSDGKTLVGDAQAPGALNITVCDYLSDLGKNPGSGCPTWQAPELWRGSKQCPIEGLNRFPTNALIEYTTGDWMPGTCQIRWYWYDSDKATYGSNPFKTGYQFEATIHDSLERVIGNVAKSFVNSLLSIENTALPYKFYAKLPPVDNKQAPIEFWYAGEHWVSDAPGSSCSGGGGGFNGENKQGHCFFPCPDVPSGAPSEKDVPRDHALPPGPYQTPVAFGHPLAIHHYPTIRDQPQEPDRSGAKSDYSKSNHCFVRVTQYWFGQDDIDNFQFEAYVGADVDPPDYRYGEWNGQVPAIGGAPNHIYGLPGDLDVRFYNPKEHKMDFVWRPNTGDHAGKTFKFDSDARKDKQNPDYYCNEELGWKYGKRQVWCLITHC